MRNFLGAGIDLPYTNDTDSNIASGAVVVLGHSLAVATSDIAAGADGILRIHGVFSGMPKISGAVFAQGEKLIWDVSAGAFDDSNASPAAGDITGAAIAAEAGDDGETTCSVILTPGNTDLTITPEVVETAAWDPDTTRENTTLSNGNLTASVSSFSGSGTNSRGRPSRSTGKHVLRLQYNFSGPPEDEELECGLATPAWPWDREESATTFVGGDEFSWSYLANGVIAHGNALLATGLPVLATGEHVDFLVDFDAGKVWITTPDGTTGDPVAGTGAAFTFTPNTPLYPAFWAYSDAGTVNAVLVPDYATGAFAAW